MKLEAPSGRQSGLPPDLPGWLRHIESQHPHLIDMGLDRVAAVREALGLSPRFPVIVVGGTNGKGSACAMLESILVAAGYRVGCYTSPHLVRYNERVCIDRVEAGDDELCEAFGAVEAARATTPLTYFEFGTLAAMWHFVRKEVDVAILEVGLGGRLDAVNVFDADCAIVTSIGIDHVEYLGSTRESIGGEKAGIFRTGRPAIVGDRAPPESLREHARRVGARWLALGEDFSATGSATDWRYEGPGGMRAGLPYPALRGKYQILNAATVITALDTLRDEMPVSAGAIREGLLTTTLRGRFQVLPGRPVVILDVAHNPDAAESLAASLRDMAGFHRTLAVLGMLKDKDIGGVTAALREVVDAWYLAPLPGPRGADVACLSAAMGTASVLDEVNECTSVPDAMSRARERAGTDDRILVFGSFLTVAQSLEFLDLRGG